MKNSFTYPANTSQAEQHATEVMNIVKTCVFTAIAILIFVLKGSIGA